MMSEVNAVLETEASIGSLARVGYLAGALLVTTTFGWGAIAQISGAVVASGTISFESNLKRVQHLEGGTVAEILVSEGQAVQKGQLLARLEDTIPAANAGLADERFMQLTARKARLEAQRIGATKSDARQEPWFTSQFAKMVSSEDRILSEQNDVLEQKRAQLQEQIVQATEQVQGLQAQKSALEAQSGLLSKELTAVSTLYEKGFAPAVRVSELQRESERLSGDAAGTEATIAQTRAQIAETRLRAAQLDSEAMAQTLADIKEADLELAQIRQEHVASSDRMNRIELRAPVSGWVQQISQTVGGVIGPGETLMVIVPSTEPLVLEARVDPQHIDQVQIGKAAQIRFTSFASNMTPELSGHLYGVSADAQVDQRTGAAFYLARVRLDSALLPAEFRGRLVPGMPAEVHIATTPRTALSYFLKPLTDQLQRTFRED